MPGVRSSVACRHPPPLGASLLAMVVNDNAGGLIPLGALGTIASRLAPTGEHLRFSGTWVSLRRVGAGGRSLLHGRDTAACSQSPPGYRAP
ncbi:hypothetical protein EJA72_08185 [Pseudomonas sp. PB120]|nr:hypothetical protein [Pseudomonas sp. PB120]